MAQDVTPVIYLTPAETAKAKQLAQNAKNAQARLRLAKTAWRNFYGSFQAAHPELQHLRFTSDFKFAMGETESGLVGEVVPLRLSPTERQRAEALYRAVKDADAAEPAARDAWMRYQYGLVAAHVPTSKVTDGVGLSDGTQVRVPPGWDLGLAFTPDFRVAVPKHP